MGTVPRLYNRLTSAVADTMVSLNDYVRGEPAAQAEQTTAGIATELTILVVDDAPINIAILDKALTREGYRVLTACSGPQARELAITHQPDLIILDVMMPGEDGFDVMRRLKGDARTTAIPVIFLTGKDDVESKVEGFALGAVDYITKPFYPPEVKARVQLHLKLHRATSALLASQAEKLMQLHEAQTSLLVSPSDLPFQRISGLMSTLLSLGVDQVGGIVVPKPEPHQYISGSTPLLDSGGPSPCWLEYFWPYQFPSEIFAPNEEGIRL